MSDNSTAEEQVNVPTQAQLEKELEKGIPKPFNQWWIRFGLIALGIWAGVFWLWLKKNVFNRPVVLLLAVIFTAEAQNTNVYYEDPVNGLDFNSGRTKVLAFQHLPLMPNFTGIYNHTNGDTFVCKGGTTNLPSCFPFVISAGGSGIQSDVYTVDQTWFVGSVFTRPIFDGGYSVSSIMFFNAANNITFDSYEMRYPSTPGFGYGTYTSVNSTNNILTNCWLHGWRSATTFDKSSGGYMFQYNGSIVINNDKILNCIIENSENGPLGLWNGECIHGGGVVSNSLILSNSSGIDFAQDVNECIIGNIHYPYNGYDESGGFHFNGFYMDNGAGNASLSSGVNIYLRNTYFYDVSGGANMAYPNIEKEDCYIYNDVFYGVMSAQLAINIDPYNFGNPPSTVKSCYIFNNTCSNYFNNSVFAHLSTRPGDMPNNLCFTNNHIMGVLASLTDANGTECVFFGAGNNIIEPPVQSSPYFSITNKYAPIYSNSPTVHAGQNLSALFSIDINGLLRGTDWDISAYQFGSGTNILTTTKVKIIYKPNSTKVNYNHLGVKIHK